MRNERKKKQSKLFPVSLRARGDNGRSSSRLPRRPPPRHGDQRRHRPGGERHLQPERRGVPGEGSAARGVCKARLPAAEVLAALEAAGVPCDAEFYENAMYRLFDDPLVKELGLIVGTQSPTYGLIEQPGIYWDMGDVPIEITQASPDLGQHSNEVMRDLGFSDAEIAKFREQKIIA